MNITPSFFVIAAAYVVTVVIILYWTFKDKIMKPVWGRLVAAIAAFAAVAVGGSMGYVIFGPDSYVQPFITVVTALGCFFIPYIVLDYNLGQCLFISGIVKCYADDIALLATFLYYLISDDLPEEYMDFPLWPVLLVTAVTFPLIMLFYRKPRARTLSFRRGSTSRRPRSKPSRSSWRTCRRISARPPSCGMT